MTSPTWTESNLPGSVVATVYGVHLRVDPVYGHGPTKPATMWRGEAWDLDGNRRASLITTDRAEAQAFAEAAHVWLVTRAP